MEAFRLIYDRHRADVHRFALFLTGDWARAEDLVADTFVRAWCARGPIREETIKAYLFTIARNLHRDELRRRRDHVSLEAAWPDHGPGVHALVEHRTTLERVRRMLRRVPRGDRRALLLFVFREMSYAEIAAALGITVGATRSRISRARDALNHALEVAPRETP
jgi:RNA polymerase sigma-70 factor (ECF subfamily)